MVAFPLLAAVAGAPARAASAPGAVSTGRVYSTSFESINDFAGFYIVPPGHMGTASHEQTTEQVHSGTYAHKGWIYGANPPSTPTQNNSHRAYPTIQLDNTPGGGFVCPCEVTLWVWLDVPLDDAGEWFSFATFTPDPTDSWSPVFGVNVSAPNPAPGTVAGGVVHLMHVPNQGERQPTFQTSTIMFPFRQWVQLRINIDYDPVHGHAEVWQDGQLVSAAPVNGGNGKLEQAHFGLYADSHVASGVAYNDDLTIREAPLSVGGVVEAPEDATLSAGSGTAGAGVGGLALGASASLIMALAAWYAWRQRRSATDR